MKSNLPFLFIFSVFSEKLTKQSCVAQHDWLLDDLIRAGYDAREVKGIYNGMEEHSIMLIVPFNQVFAATGVVEYLCLKHKQECYLISNNERKTHLVYPNGTRKYIGVFQEANTDLPQEASCTKYLNKTYVTL